MLHVIAHVVLEAAFLGVVNELLFVVGRFQDHRGNVDYAHDAPVVVAFVCMLFGVLVHENETMAVVDEEAVCGTVVDVDAKYES